MKIKILAGILLILLARETRAQQDEFERLRDSISREFQAQASANQGEFRHLRDSIAKEFQNFRDSVNREFAKFLEQPWNSFSIIPPGQIPRYGRSHPARQHSIAKNSPSGNKEKNFFGLDEKISFPRQIPTGITNTSEKAVGGAWRTLGNSDFSGCLAECLLLSARVNLNTWGYYQLLVHLTGQLPLSPEMQIVVQCFLMNHGGYKCRMGAIDRELVLLVPFNAKVYDLCHVELDGVPYYIPGKKHISADKLKTYTQEIKFATRLPDLFLHAPLKLGPNQLIHKTLLLDKAKIIIPVNKNLIDFYATYPTCDLRVYASAPLDSMSLIPLQEALAQEVPDDAKTHEILHFIHTNFQNQPDSLAWGRERYFFAEESLYYPYLDCEDSAILFRQLVNRLTNREAILVVYPGHVSAAVDLPVSGTDKHVLYRDKKYVICEPSYIGASPGRQMPRTEGLKELFCY